MGYSRRSQKSRTTGSIASSNITTSLIENIRSNVGRYQTNFNETGSQDVSIDTILAEENLRYVWNNAYYGVPEGCPQCKGKYDYVIQPVSLQPDLMKITIRMVNPEVFEGIREYVFVTGVK